MAQYLTIIELEKKLDLDKYKFVYEEPFIYRQKLAFYNYSSYFTDIYGSPNDTNATRRNITDVTINSIEYAVKTSYADMAADEESFYFDILNQVLYIHLNHAYHIFAYNIYAGDLIGFVNHNKANGDPVIYNDIVYKPLLKQVPSLEISIDPGVYKLFAFFGGSFVLNNWPTDFLEMRGYWDNSYLDNPEGNLISILYGLDDYAYGSLIQFARFKITNHRVSLAECSLSVKDRRSLLTKKIPEINFDATTYPDISDDMVGKEVPLAFGVNKGVPGICIDTKAAGNKTFKVPAIDVLYDIWVQQPNDTWERKNYVSIDLTNGLIEIAEADIYEGGTDSGKLLNMKVDGCFGNPITLSSPGEIIKYILLTYYGMVFDASNYNMTEWTSEDAYLEDVGIYIDKKTSIYEIIELLQNSSNFGFYYEQIYDTRTLRIDNPNRAIARTVQAVENLDIANCEYEILEDDYYTQVNVKYSPDRFSGRYNSYQNTDYEEAVKREYNNQDIESDDIRLQCIERQTAIDRSVITMEDKQKSRFRTSCKLSGITAFSLRVLDIVSIDFTQYYLDKDRDLLEDDWRDREFLGVQRCKIISRKPDLENGTVSFDLRECPESDIITNIINNKNWFYDHMSYYSGTHFSKYWIWVLGSGEISSVLDGDDRVISVGNGAGVDDRLWTYHSKLIPYDSTKLYEVRAIIKRTAGIGTIYVGIEGVNADGVTMENINGADQHASQHYFAAENVAPGTAWTEYKGYFSGAAAAGNGGQHNDIADPGTVHEDAYYIRGMFILNEITTGTTLIKEFQIRMITN
ncbi:MAG: hypothetical protein ACM31M_07335 [Nitrososphaerota archaeon]